MPTGWLQAQTCCLSIPVEGREAKGCPPARKKPPKSSNRANGRLPPATTLMGRNCLGIVSFRHFSRLQGRNTHPFSAIEPPLSSFLLHQILLILIPTYVKQRQRMETEGTTITTLWEGACHVNCCLQRAWRSCEERGMSKARKGYLSMGQG